MKKAKIEVRPYSLEQTGQIPLDPNISAEVKFDLGLELPSFREKKAKK